MGVSVYYTDINGRDRCSNHQDWMSAHIFETKCRERGCTNIRVMDSNDNDQWDSLFIAAGRLIYYIDLSPMMAIAHVLHERGLNNSDAAEVMTEILGRPVRSSVARDYMRRAAEKMGDRPK